MNIFVLDRDPRLAAAYHMDAHVARQLMACAQLLSVAHVYLDGLALARNRVPHLVERIRDHERDQQWAQWARHSNANYHWLHQHMEGLFRQYSARFGEIAPYSRLLGELHSTPFAIPMDEFRYDWPKTMPAYFRRHCVVESYRTYYVKAKREIGESVRWSPPAIKPAWWVEMEEHVNE
jgi:hypothetical protein